MAEYMTLIGAESVQTAGYTMKHAAEEMKRAAESFEYSVQTLARILTEHAERIEAATKTEVTP